MGFQDVEFLPPSQATFLPHFLKIVIRVKASGPPPVLITVVGGKQGHASCGILSLQQSLFLSVKFHGDHRTVTKLR